MWNVLWNNLLVSNRFNRNIFQRKRGKVKMGSDFDDDFSRIFTRNNMELRDEIMKYVGERFINKKKIEEVIEKSKDFYDKEEVTNLLIDLLYK